MSSRYIFNRLLLLIPTLFGLLLGVFLLLHIAPGDPVELLYDLQQEYIPQEVLDQIRKDFGLDLPLHVQFGRYVGQVLQGNLGYSYRTNLPVTRDIVPRIVPTLQLALAGMAMGLLIGIPSGVISALKPNTWMDYLTLTGSMVGLSAPNFWLGVLFIYIFAFRLSWLPIIGAGDGGVDTLRHLILPSLVIGTSLAALLARLTRAAVLEVKSQDYILTARSKGLRERRIISLHVMRNAAIPVVAAAGTVFATLLTGSVVVELVFSRPGLGRLMILALNNRDFPMIQALILVFGFVIVMTNLASDFLIAWLDPRVSYDK